MIKRLLLLSVLFFVFIVAKAQPYGNEWINYSQKYFKIKVAQTGVYRVDSLALANAGIDLATVDPRNFQLFHDGMEQYIYVKGESDGILNATDHIEFYGERNDGKGDTALYVNSAFVPNPYYSLINDTAVYYLTWNASLSNRRFQIETDTAFSAFTPDNYFFKEEIKSFSNAYYEGETDIVGGTDSRYTRSEGWFDNQVFTLGGSVSYTSLLNTSNAYTAGPSALITSVVVGASKASNLISQNLPDHHLKIDFRGSSGSYATIADTLFMGYEANRFNVAIPTSSLGNTFTDFLYTSVADTNFVSNRTVVSYIKIRYPHTFDLEGKPEFDLFQPDNTLQSKSFLNIQNFNGTSGTAIYDLTNNKRIPVIFDGLNYKALVPNSGQEKHCYVFSETTVRNVSTLVPVTTTGFFTDYSIQSVDSAYLIISHKDLMSEANLYKQYRTSSLGGSHHVVLADIDELYDQFAFGIVKSPLSIKRFTEYLVDTYPSAPQNMFIIGKSIHLSNCRTNSSNYNLCLVPSFGNPSSDNLLTEGINGTQMFPYVPVGRLAARSAADVTTYLDKVQDYESASPDEWMKYGLHFGGGGSLAEQQQLRSYLDGYKTIFQDSLYGGTVIKEFWKTSTAPIQINIADTLEDLINNGVSFLNFFGHASANSFDQSIDQITSFNPIQGRYPFMLSNACYSGDIHAGSVSSSEEYVLVQNKGLIGFLGSIKLGVPYALNTFSSEFYRQFSLVNYGNGVGSSIKNTIAAIQPNASVDPLVRSTCYEMTLHGDPAIKLNAQRVPDFKISNSDVSVDLTAQIDSFTVYVIRTNIGRTSDDSVFTEVIHTLPNGDTLSYFLRDVQPKFKDTVSFKVWIDPARTIGLNKIKVRLDAYSEVEELNEFNNETTSDLEFQIDGGLIAPVYPYEFAIVPTDSITLKASTLNVFAPSRTYVFQVDTTDTFNSSFLMDTTITSIGGVVSWKLPFTFSDSTVYYWRVSPDSVSASSGYIWRESSFQYIAGKKGWGQAHFFQYKNDQTRYVKFNRPDRRFDFVNDVKDIYCIDGIYPYYNWTDIQWKLNGIQKTYWTCIQLNSGFNFVVFDPVSGENWTSPLPSSGNCSSCNNGIYNNAHCRTYDMNTFDFMDVDSIQRSHITNFINNNIPNGHYVMAYSFNHTKFDQYENSLYSAFESLGSGSIRTISPSRPYILFGRKGAPIGSASEVIGDSMQAVIEFDTTLVTNWNEGYIASPVIGPASQWGSFHWRQHAIEGSATDDSVVVRLIGIKSDGTENTLANFVKDSTDILNLSTYVDAAVYPNIRLVAYMKDDSLHTSPQMERWQVIYSPVPEAALNPPLGYTINDTILQEGDVLQVNLPIQNIGEIAFSDSLLVSYWVEDADKVNHPLPDKLKRNLFAPNEVIIDSIVLNTEGFRGNNSLWVEVNPINKSRSQLEQYHFNNIVRIPFYTSVDRINPLLDVTFDGIHILNNDIVSSRPNVLIQLKDENQFLALNDTSDFKVFIQAPGSSVAERIYFGSTMTFTPAMLPNNSCKINYTPSLTADGTYQLIVQAKDKSDNQSGLIDYKINFEVVNKATITEVMNYPNPFSTSTKFVFTLTGSEVPTTFKIQIMTISGKVVKEIFQDELGPLHVGRNITQYAWDGKDEFGDQLANGVYLYRVITKLNGEDIEKRETDADQYFKKGWGKMYLMR
ncbi:MAG: hypothetical protein J0L87_00705 [Bacteroidetes bacterium]|nr:hypothetical protein [Bacteroidota bacterium]